MSVTEHDYFPSDVSRYSYAMVGWPKTVAGPQWIDKYCMVSGQGGYDRTSKLLLERCKHDTGIDCEISQVAIGEIVTKQGDVIASYYNPLRGTFWMSSRSLIEAAAAMKRDCSRDNVTCDYLTTYDTFSARNQILDIPSVR